MLYAAVKTTTSKAMAELRAMIDRKIKIEKKGCLKTSVYTVIHTETIMQLIRKLPVNRYAVFCCVEAGSMRDIDWIGESALIEQYLISPEQNIAQAIRNYKIRLKSENRTQYEKVEP